MLRMAQNAIAISKSQDLSLIPSKNEDWWREYYRSMGVLLLEEYERRYQDRDQEEPLLGQVAMAQCSHPGCSKSSYVDAWYVWRAKKHKEQLQTFCPEHSKDACPVEPKEFRPSIRATMRAACELDKVLFELDAGHPRMVAAEHLGLLKIARSRWKQMHAYLSEELGDNYPSELTKARQALGVSHIFAPGYQRPTGPTFE